MPGARTPASSSSCVWDCVLEPPPQLYSSSSSGLLGQFCDTQNLGSYTTSSAKYIWFCNVVAGFARSCPAGHFHESPPWGTLFEQEDDDDGFDIVVQRMDGVHRCHRATIIPLCLNFSR